MLDYVINLPQERSYGSATEMVVTDAEGNFLAHPSCLLRPLLESFSYMIDYLPRHDGPAIQPDWGRYD